MVIMAQHAMITESKHSKRRPTGEFGQLDHGRLPVLNHPVTNEETHSTRAVTSQTSQVRLAFQPMVVSVMLVSKAPGPQSVSR